MPVTKENVQDVFTYHAPDAAQQAAYICIREKALELAESALAVVPICADQQAGFRLLREAVMTFNAAIALHGAI